jgi:hypothetical protein
MRHDLASQKIATCADVLPARDGKWLTVAGLVRRVETGRGLPPSS